MRKIFIFVLAIAFLSTVTTQGLCATGVITTQTEVQHVHIETNQFGIATKSTTTTTSTVVTQNADGSKTTSTSVTVVTADWRAGSLKTSSIVSNSTEKNDQTGVVLNSSNYTDTYKYNEVTGILESVSGTGNTMTFDEESGQRNIGTLTRSFTVRDGQALLTSSRNEGVVNDKNGVQIGTFNNTTTIAESDYAYLGGSWVPMKQTSVQTNNMNDGSSTVVTKTTTYNRDANGTITGMSQTATGTRIVVTGKDTAQESTKTYTLQNYNANITFDAQEGWYSAGEDYDWVLSSSTTPPPGSQGGATLTEALGDYFNNGWLSFGIWYKDANGQWQQEEIFSTSDGKGTNKQLSAAAVEAIKNGEYSFYLNNSNGYEFYSNQSWNADGFGHARVNVSGNTIDISWEDLWGGGDQDFNDFVVRIII